MSFQKLSAKKVSIVKKPIVVQKSESKVTLKQSNEPNPEDAPRPNICAPTVPAAGQNGNQSGQLGPGDVACGISPESSYTSVIVQQFTVVGDSKEITRLARNLATNCPALNENSVNIPALQQVALCKKTSVVKFIPGDTLSAVNFPDPETGIVENPFTGTPIQTPEDLTNTNAALATSGVSIKKQSTQQVLAVYTVTGIAGVYADIYDRFYDNIDIRSIYTDESGLLVIIEVAPEKLHFARTILATPRGELVNLPCYNCPCLPVPTESESCYQPVLNCNFKYPCALIKCKDSDKKGKSKHDDSDSDSDSSHKKSKHDKNNRSFRSGDKKKCRSSDSSESSSE